MSQTFGSINFGNIPVAAGGGISVLGARQGVWNNGGYIELGNTNVGDTSTYITNQRYIVVQSALWCVSVDNSGWRTQTGLEGMTVLNNGEEWKFMQTNLNPSVGQSLLRIESLHSERGIQFYNVGSPTGERGAVVWKSSGLSGNLVIRNSDLLYGTNAGILIDSDAGGDIAFTVGTNPVMSLTELGEVQLGSIPGVYIQGVAGDVKIKCYDASAVIALFTNTQVAKFGSGANNALTGQLGIGSLTAAVGTARLRLLASGSAIAHFNLEPGSAPSAPVDGDVWFDGTDLFMRVGGVTKTFTLV